MLTATYKAAYESGFYGFISCRELNMRGMECGATNTSDLPLNHRGKMQKTDKTDSRKLAKVPRSGDADMIHIPSRELSVRPRAGADALQLHAVAAENYTPGESVQHTLDSCQRTAQSPRKETLLVSRRSPEFGYLR